MPTGTLVNYYTILEVTPSATDEQIKEAIKLQRRTWVKRQQAPSPERQREAEDRVRRIDDAEKTLLDGARRRSYDAELAAHKPEVGNGGPSLDGSANWLERAKEFLARGDAQSAAYAARQATDSHGANDEAWAVRARADFMCGREQDAIFEFNEAIRIRPTGDEYHFDLGSVYESKQQWKLAMDCYEAASKVAPDNPLYRVAVASVYLNNDLAGQALPILESVHKDHPHVASFNFYLAWALNDVTVDSWTHLRGGGTIITTKEQIETTKRNLQRALTLDTDDAEVRSLIKANLKKAEDADGMRFRLPGWTVAKKSAALGASTGSVGNALGCGGCMLYMVYAGIIAVIGAGFSASPILGVFLLIAAAGAVYKTAWRPVYQWNHIDTRSQQVSPKTGAAPVRR